MKLGLFDHRQKHDNPARSYVDLYRSDLEVVEFADQAGLDFYFVAEHHFDMGFSECPSPGAFLGEFTFGELTQKQALNSLGLFASESCRSSENSKSTG